MSISKKVFGKTADNNEVYIFTLTNTKGAVAEIINYGGILVSLKIPDKAGTLKDVVLGYDNLEKYFKNDTFFGAIIGRNSNRIKNATFEMNGKVYQVSKNSGEHQLHGGFRGFDQVVWNAEIKRSGDAEALELTYRSKDGEEGFPGNVDVKVTYTLTEENGLVIDYFAMSDQDTVVNLTNHSYFNLSGHNAGDIGNHKVKIYADEFTVIDKDIIPTGEIRSVKGTAMDFREFAPLEKGFASSEEQIKLANGYDHNWILKVSGEKPEKAVEVYDEASGIGMEVYTTKPGVQMYSGNFLNDSYIGKGGAVYGKRSGLCLETQYFPNALEHKHFPSPILRAGQEYKHTTIYKFLAK